MVKRVNIIGAGIAGLSAGCYLQMNGYETRIFELHDIPGGLCTSWKRGDYTFDGCIHWLVGSNPSDGFYRLWSELIDMDSLRFIEYDEFARIEDGEGGCIRFFSNIDRLENELMGKAPDDTSVIKEFTNAIRKLTGFNGGMSKPREMQNFMDGFRSGITMLPYMNIFRKWIKVSAGEFASRCTNPLLRQSFEQVFIPELSVLFLMMTMAWFSKKSAGYPIGGSLMFAREIEKRYLDLGGKIEYGKRIEKIETKDGMAVGVIDEEGVLHESDIVISAADGNDTIFNMLGGEFIDEGLRKYYSEYSTFSSYLQIGLGVGIDLSEHPVYTILPLVKPLVVDDETTVEHIDFRIFNFDPTLAPKGKSVCQSLVMTYNHEYWVKLRQNDYAEYKAQKQRIADTVIDAAEKRFGDIRANIEVIDVSSPATVIRYTNNWRGSFEGWMLTPKTGFFRIRRELPGLSNFFMAGQWVEPGGGLPTALTSGREIAQLITHRDGKDFETSR